MIWGINVIVSLALGAFNVFNPIRSLALGAAVLGSGGSRIANARCGRCEKLKTTPAFGHPSFAGGEFNKSAGLRYPEFRKVLEESL